MNTYFSNLHKERGGVNTGMLYIIVILLIITAIAYIATGPTPTQTGVQKGVEVAILGAPSQAPKDLLQLYSFGGATITPPVTDLCKPGGKNARPDIIVGVYPPHAEAISVKDKIKVWVNTEKPPLIANGEKVNRNSGIIITPGNREEKAPDGLYVEPSLYIFPQTAESGGQPYFPSSIKGDFTSSSGSASLAFGIERIPGNPQLKHRYTAQYSWNVKDLGLRAGSYQLQFVVMDDADKHGVTCVNMRVYEVADPRFVIPI